MAFNDRIGAAFQVREILNVISEISWIKYIIWIIGVAIIQLGALGMTLFAFFIIPALGISGAAAMAQIAREIPTTRLIIVLIILGLILYLFVIPYLQIFYARALGRLYADR